MMDFSIPGFNPQGDGSEWDGRTVVYDTNRNVVGQYDNYQTPTVYMANNGNFYHGVPGTPEYDAMQDARRRSNRRGVTKVAALVGGAGALGALGGGGGMSLGQGAGMSGRGALVRGIVPGDKGPLGSVVDNLMPKGPMDWIKLGGTGLGALGALGGTQDQPAPVAPTTSTHRPQTMRRTRNAMSPSQYANYGKQGGEHRFFSDPTYADSATPLAAAGASGAGALPTPTGYVPDRALMEQMTRGMGLRFAHGGVAGPGSGREDKIEALLSDGEYVIDAESVALLGDGSVDEGAARLDQLRENLRKHKGAALAKGKFTPDAKRPEEYMGLAKGGPTRVVAGKDTLRHRMEKVQQMRQVEDELRSEKADPKLQEALQRLEALRELANKNPVKRAQGGPAVNDMHELADKLDAALKIGTPDVLEGVMGEVEIKMAKGGFIDNDVVNSILEKYKPKRQTSPEDLTALAAELRRMQPKSEVLRQYDSAQQPRTYAPRRQGVK